MYSTKSILVMVSVVVVGYLIYDHFKKKNQPSTAYGNLAYANAAGGSATAICPPSCDRNVSMSSKQKLNKILM